MQFLEEMMNQNTKTVLLNRVYILNRDIDRNEMLLGGLKEEVDSVTLILEGQNKERAALIEDLTAAGVEVDAAVQD
jgi:hypothetical protein